MNALIENIEKEPEWWVKHLMHTREWLIVRLGQIMEAADEENWEHIQEVLPVLKSGLKGYKDEQHMYNEGRGYRATSTGGKRFE